MAAAVIDRLVQSVVLPAHISDFERGYLQRINRLALWLFSAHVPAFIFIALINHQSWFQAAWLTTLVLVGPLLAHRTLDNPRSISLVYGFSSMLMGGVLVHIGQGPVQIEMHFYFFALLAMLAVFGNPLVIVVAAVTVALHHFVVWLYLPQSVFNYAAPFWVVLVHAAFVVLESIATCYIARSFFDNVIGLERIIRARTAALDERNRDMRLVLDTVNQGLLMVNRDLVMSTERSTVLKHWFGAATTGETLTEYVGKQDPDFAQSLAINWDQVLADLLPLELALDQLPKHFKVADRCFDLAYTPIFDDTRSLTQLLVVINDVTAHRQRERLEAEQRDVIQLLGCVAKDRYGVQEFLNEARDLVLAISDAKLDDRTIMKRLIHTLKGNAMIFGVQTVATICHELESEIEDSSLLPASSSRAALRTAWTQINTSMDMLLGHQSKNIEIGEAEYTALLTAIARGDKPESLRERVHALKLDPSSRRLMRAADQAQATAKRLGKPALHIGIEDHGVRLDPDQWSTFWAAFVHVIRNAVDHGIEAPDERVKVNKAPEGSLTLRTELDNGTLIISVRDDGRGIDWNAIADSAQRRGLPHQSQRDLIEALFADGLSTRSEVSEYSGRGIGMSVLRDACRSRGGEVHVESVPGHGTTIAFRFPGAAIEGSTWLRRAS